MHLAKRGIIPCVYVSKFLILLFYFRTFNKFKPYVQQGRMFQKKPYLKNNNNTNRSQDFSMYQDPWIPLVRKLVNSGKLDEHELVSDYSFLKPRQSVAFQLDTEAEDVVTDGGEKLESIEVINDEEIDIDL
jgi:hypothetical protein